MLFVNYNNLHPHVREHLWLRSSGAVQYMKTYDGYADDISNPNSDNV